MIAILLLPGLAASADPAEEAYQKGLSCFDRHEYDAAIAAFTEAIRLRFKPAVSYCARGIVYEQQGQHDKAIADYTESIRLDAKYASAYRNRGGAYGKKGDYNRAIADYSTVIRLVPKFAPAYVSRGMIYEQIGRHDQAIDDFTAAIGIDPNSAKAYNSRSLAYSKKGDNASASADLKQAARLSGDGQTNATVTLAQARQGFKTKPTERGPAKEAVPEPPPDVFRTVRYDSPAGKLAAYLTPDPKDGKKHPAIIWIHGGNCNSIDESLWHAAPASNDQTAAAYRKSGIIMMFPSLRGGNDNPGVREGFFGEVNDVLAAAEFLGKQPFVDPQRIYLGGHSTGGTLVLLVAECSDRFRAVFSFGPALSAGWHQRQNVPFDASSTREVELRVADSLVAVDQEPRFRIRRHEELCRQHKIVRGDGEGVQESHGPLLRSDWCKSL